MDRILLSGHMPVKKYCEVRSSSAQFEGFLGERFLVHRVIEGHADLDEITAWLETCMRATTAK